MRNRSLLVVPFSSIFGSLLLLAWVSGCGTPSEENGNGNGGEQEPTTLGATAHGSCGESIGLGEGISKRNDREEWCEAERLIWHYDADSRSLTLLHSRVTLNCCADHSVTYEQVAEIHVITEVDNIPRDGRCRCTCLFDFRTTLQGVPPGTASILLLSDVEENEGTEIVWEGELDLSHGEGEIVLDDKETSYCDVFGP